MKAAHGLRRAPLFLASLAAPLALAGTQPWSAPAAASAPAAPVDPAHLPDIAGVHVGTPSTEVPGILQKLHPGAEVRPIFNGQGMPPAGVAMNVGTSVPTPNFDSISVNYTFDSGKQLVYSVSREFAYPQPIARTKYIAAAREKYGPETLSISAGNEAKSDSAIEQMYWLFDESGRVIHPGNYQFQTHSPYGCQADYASNDLVSMYRELSRSQFRGDLKAATYCDGVIALVIKLPYGDLLPRVDSVLTDFPIARRSAIALGNAQKAQAQQAQQQEQRNANQAKPSL